MDVDLFKELILDKEKREEWCKKYTPEIYERKPDIGWIEDFILRAYKDDI